MSEVYLGDGLYARLDGMGMIALTADKDSPQQRTVYLDRAVFEALAAFAESVWGGEPR